MTNFVFYINYFAFMYHASFLLNCCIVIKKKNDKIPRIIHVTCLIKHNAD